MAKICMTVLLVLFSVVLLSISAVEGIDKSPKAVEEWFKQVPYKKQIISKLRFYVHETTGGKYGRTIYPVVQQLNISSKSDFGRINMYDNPLKTSQDPESEIVGTAQGTSSSASLSERALLMTLHFTFTIGKFNDSSLTIVGHNPVNDDYREISVVGGSGVFRLAQGIATAQTSVRNPVTGDVTYEYNVIVIHYDTPSKMIDNIIPSSEMNYSFEMLHG